MDVQPTNLKQLHDVKMDQKAVLKAKGGPTQY